MNDRISRSSIVSPGGQLNTPVKALISRIKLISGGYDVPEFDPALLYNTDIQVEQVLVNRKLHKVRKVYVVACPEYKIGWIVDTDLSVCMLCTGRFGWTRYRHHCRYSI